MAPPPDRRPGLDLGRLPARRDALHRGGHRRVAAAHERRVVGPAARARGAGSAPASIELSRSIQQFLPTGGNSRSFGADFDPSGTRISGRWNPDDSPRGHDPAAGRREARLLLARRHLRRVRAQRLEAERGRPRSTREAGEDAPRGTRPKPRTRQLSEPVDVHGHAGPLHGTADPLAADPERGRPAGRRSGSSGRAVPRQHRARRQRPVHGDRARADRGQRAGRAQRGEPAGRPAPTIRPRSRASTSSVPDGRHPGRRLGRAACTTSSSARRRR